MTDIPSPELVSSIIDKAARDVVLPHFRALAEKDVWKKTSGGTVTTADLASEVFLKDALTNLLPGSTTLGEEECDDDPSILHRLTEKAPVWVIDPVDGTSNYARGEERFAILVALWCDGAVQAGWICAPAMNRMIYAIKGQGAWENGKRLMIDTPSRTRDALRGSLGGRVRRVEGIESQFSEVTNLKCCGVEYLEIASGTLDFAHYRQLRPWDHCGGTLIVEEAGGVAACHEANPYDPLHPSRDGVLIAGSNAIFNQVDGIIGPALESFRED